MKQKKSMKMNRPLIKLFVLTIILSIVLTCSFCFGRYHIGVLDLFKILFSRVIHMDKTWTDQMEAVVFNIRLPRIILSCMVGSCLAVAGVSYQGVFQNPMASPDFLGATSGAAFGAALAILLGLSSAMISAYAFLFSIITVGLVYLIGRYSPGNPVINLILAGIMVSSLFTAGTSFIKLVADPMNELPSITYWLMGSFSGAKRHEITFVAIPMLLGMIPLMGVRWRLNLLAMGDEACESMGVNANQMRLVVILASTIITAASVSVSGMIGWVGLVIPHLCRKVIGNDYKYLMPTCMVTGAIFMLGVDNISRNLLETEIPIGILTAFIGAPFFIYLIFRKESRLS
ncbi:iron ABC transporter permease [Fusibacter sp. Q10-2]|uniref:Iron ABC transporter permease n=2 Tax=Fusibacter ferrireducens TaxID=2785058 RepID=A0ABR9ZPX0_9FIRM|nr:iron ABC transporter permease [Fusibacter ferrireducens]